jgi:ABC-type bacteriocin/lantibiotic exporter with double-glycine peptidase domain
MVEVRVPQHVEQLDRLGCGIACVASLAALPYERVRERALDLFEWSKCERTHSAQLRTLLQSFGMESLRGRSVRNWDVLPDRAVVAINPIGNNWHWVVHHRLSGYPVVLDSNAQRQARTDFSRMRLRSYIPVL